MTNTFNRHEDALYINWGGACNPRGISRTLVKAVDQCCEERNATDVKNDAAVKLIVHQLCHLAGIAMIAEDYDVMVRECVSKSSDSVVETLGLVSFKDR